MPAPLDPVEKVRRLTAMVERGESTLRARIAEDLGLPANVLASYAAEARAGYGDLAAALESARAELSDDDARAAAASECMARAKTVEHARLLFNGDRGDDIKWGAFKRLLVRAAERGLDGSTPAPPPPGQVVKGLSTMHVRDPETGAMRESVVWTKTRQDAPDPADAIRRASEALRRAPRLAPIPHVAKPRRAALLNKIVVTDSHIGQESTVRETGALWSVDEAERVTLGAVNYLMSVAPPAETALVAFLGDYLDFEGPPPQTFTSHNPLPNSASFPAMVEAGARIARAVIDLALTRHDRVKVVALDGNHDPASAPWMRVLLAAVYEREPRVEVVFGKPRDAPHVAYQHGKTMLGFAHQHLTKSSELPQMFRDEYREMFGATTHCEVHCGHLHHYKVESYGAVKVHQHPTLAARSRHIARHGYAEDRGMRLATFHEDGGRRFEALFMPQMLEVA